MLNKWLMCSTAAKAAAATVLIQFAMCNAKHSLSLKKQQQFSSSSSSIDQMGAILLLLLQLLHSLNQSRGGGLRIAFSACKEDGSSAGEQSRTKQKGRQQQKKMGAWWLSHKRNRNPKGWEQQQGHKTFDRRIIIADDAIAIESVEDLLRTEKKKKRKEEEHQAVLRPSRAE